MIYRSKTIYVPHRKFTSMLDKLYSDNNEDVRMKLINKFGQIHKLPETIKKDKNNNDVEMIEIPFEDVQYVKELYESII
jgi:hypothetical protein